MIRLFHKCKLFFQTVRTFRTWPSLLAYRYGCWSGPLTIHTRDGAQLLVRDRRTQPADAYVVNESYLYRIHEALVPYMRTAAVGLDIGAHIGAFSIYAAQRSPGKVYAFEPAKENFSLLTRNIALNHFHDRVFPLPMAVAAATGTVDLYLASNLGFASLFPTQAAGGGAHEGDRVRSVSAVTLEDFFRREGIARCDFIKMDCEGSEYDILYHTPPEVLRRIGALSIECHAVGSMEELAAFLSRHGFHVTQPRSGFGVLLCVNRDAMVKA